MNSGSFTLYSQRRKQANGGHECEINNYQRSQWEQYLLALPQFVTPKMYGWWERRHTMRHGGNLGWNGEILVLITCFLLVMHCNNFHQHQKLCITKTMQAGVGLTSRFAFERIPCLMTCITAKPYSENVGKFSVDWWANSKAKASVVNPTITIGSNSRAVDTVYACPVNLPAKWLYAGFRFPRHLVIYQHELSLLSSLSGLWRRDKTSYSTY